MVDENSALPGGSVPEGNSAAGTGNASSPNHPPPANGNVPILIADGWNPKQHRASVGRKVTARPPIHQSLSQHSQSSQCSSLRDSSAPDDEEMAPGSKHGDEDTLFTQVFNWLQQEQAKRKASKSQEQTALDGATSDDGRTAAPRERSSSQSSERALALDKLEKILLQYANSRKEAASGTAGLGRKRSTRRRHHVKGLRRGSASESDHPDIDVGVPSVDAYLDNSKTLAYSGGAADDESDGTSSNSRRTREKEHWVKFKTEIIRLAHTLQLKGWRRVPIEKGAEIEVTRLSGALTNAVYVVTPPKSLLKNPDGDQNGAPRKPPPKLLLRIYGPQVDHLIDRQKELQILRRLGKKNIGPRVLGTFNNGRFEEYFNARTLTAKDLRNPETSKQIAKRMRELHEGIELLDEEREGGPFVFRNWDKWVDRCEQVISWLDKEIMSPHNASKARSEPWRKRGFVCGVPWPVFRNAFEKYREWLTDKFGGADEIKKQLVFAHNDTQYGNLLRLEPSGESPLLLPANEHKQLVVIDFEYASANPPGMEFANHFSEWCYNYHDPERSWYCNTRAYPTPEEQHRFITAYLTHRPQLGGIPSASPNIRPTPGGASRLAPFSLDALSSSPSSQSLSYPEAEKAREDALEAEVQRLMWETRLWRVVNSAQWVAWGIVQAKVPGMEEELAAAAAAKTQQGQNGNGASNSEATPTTTEATTREEKTSDRPESPVSDSDLPEADEFDYLAFSQDRAFFFWADVLTLGVIDEDELPRELVEHVKTRAIDY